jgi:HPr kinase/phosphorylase
MSNVHSDWPIVHGSGVCVAGHGVLITGASGCGKSDLALRLIDRGATLISDDAVGISIDDGLPLLRQAPNIHGKIEIFGLGIIELPAIDSVPLRLLVDLSLQTERYPDPWHFRLVKGWDVPMISLDQWMASAPLRIEYAVQLLVDRSIIPRQSAS